MSDRTTEKLIGVLAEDVTRCHGELKASIDAGQVDANGDVTADYEYHARQLIRAIFAFIEAVTFSMKVKAVELCRKQKRRISEFETYLAVDIQQALSEKGEVETRPAKISLADNIRLAF